MKPDEEYRKALSTALTKAIMETSLDAETRVIAVRSGEVIDAMVDQIAFYAASSETCQSPAKAREFCDETARRLRKRIAYMREEIAAGKLSGWTIVRDDTGRGGH
jgi:hypothetical protein